VNFTLSKFTWPVNMAHWLWAIVRKDSMISGTDIVSKHFCNMIIFQVMNYSGITPNTLKHWLVTAFLATDFVFERYKKIGKFLHEKNIHITWVFDFDYNRYIFFLQFFDSWLRNSASAGCRTHTKCQNNGIGEILSIVEPHFKLYYVVKNNLKWNIRHEKFYNRPCCLTSCLSSIILIYHLVPELKH